MGFLGELTGKARYANWEIPYDKPNSNSLDIIITQNAHTVTRISRENNTILLCSMFL
jgi:hypothetical protein